MGKSWTAIGTTFAGAHAVLGSLLLACTPGVSSSSLFTADGGPPGSEGAESPSNTSAPQAIAAANPALNEKIFTSKDEEVVMVDANAGTHALVFAFDRYVNVRSLDVIDDVLFAGTQDNSVNAIDVNARKLLWDVPLGRYETSTLAHPKVVTRDGLAYAVGIPGVLTAIDLASGKPRWLYPLSPSGETDGYYSLVGKPTVTGDRVFIGTREPNGNTLHAIDAKSGKRIWKRDLDDGVSGVLKLAGDVLLVPAGDLLAVDAKTGKTRWSVAMEPLSRGASTPTVSGNAVLVQGAVDVSEGRLFSIDLATGAVNWAIAAGNDYAGVYAPLVVEKVVFGVFERGNAMSGYGNGKPFMADIATGAILWEGTAASVETSPVYANGRLFFHGQNLGGKGGIDNHVGLLSLDAANGKLVWLDNYFRYSNATTPIVIAKNGVFRSSDDAR